MAEVRHATLDGFEERIHVGVAGCRTGWKITLVGSRFTHPAESRYAPIEGEALAVADALDMLYKVLTYLLTLFVSLTAIEAT